MTERKIWWQLSFPELEVPHKQMTPKEMDFYDEDAFWGMHERIEDPYLESMYDSWGNFEGYQYRDTHVQSASEVIEILKEEGY